jgi:hypothetical protein
MFQIFNLARKRRLSYEQLQTMQLVAQQVVLSVDASARIPGAAKKALALQLMGELLEQLGIVAPDSLIDTAIEAAVGLLKALDSQAPHPPVVPLKVDVSGRPASRAERGI